MGAVFRDVRSGRVIWAIKYCDVDGRVRRERTKATTRTLARKLLFDREDAVERARRLALPNVHEFLAPAPLQSVAAFMQEVYLPHCDVALGAGTAVRYRIAWRLHVGPKLGRFLLKDLKRMDLQQYANKRLVSGAAVSTVHQELTLVGGMYTFAMDQELVDRNPVRRVKLPRPNKKLPRFLSDAEEQHLLAVAPEPLRTAIRIAIHTGCRDGEVRNLRWTDIDFEGGNIMVRNTKSRRDRLVPMNATLREVLSKIPRHFSCPHVLVNPRTGKRYAFKLTNSAWKLALKRAAIVGFRFHDLRHTTGSRLAQLGVSPAVIMEILGHSSLQVTQMYMHLQNKNLRDAMAKLDLPPPGPSAAAGGA